MATRAFAAIVVWSLAAAVASAWGRPDPPSDSRELLAGVEVVVPNDIEPRLRPEQVALEILGQQGPDARVVSLRLFHDWVELSNEYSAGYPAGGRGPRNVWLVHAHDVYRCIQSVPPACRVWGSAHYMVLDATGGVIGFGLP